MGKGEVIAEIRKHPEITCRELEKRIGVNIASINRSIRRLLKDISENVKYRELTEEEKRERFGRNLNVKVRVFWIED